MSEGTSVCFSKGLSLGSDRFGHACMLVFVGLARADYEQLVHNVPAEAPAFTVLRRCPELYRWGCEEPLFKCVIIECDADEARLLSEAAKQHCPEAVPDIEYGIQLSRRFAVFS